MIGKDIKINFEKSFVGNDENDPRFAGNALINNKKQSNIYREYLLLVRKEKIKIVQLGLFMLMKLNIKRINK